MLGDQVEVPAHLQKASVERVNEASLMWFCTK